MHFCSMKTEFKLKNGTEYIQLDQLLKFLGLAESGADAHFMIDDGTVQVNGAIELQRRKKLRIGDTVLVESERIVIV